MDSSIHRHSHHSVKTVDLPNPDFHLSNSNNNHRHWKKGYSPASREIESPRTFPKKDGSARHPPSSRPSPLHIDRSEAQRSSFIAGRSIDSDRDISSTPRPSSSSGLPRRDKRHDTEEPANHVKSLDRPKLSGTGSFRYCKISEFESSSFRYSRNSDAEKDSKFASSRALEAEKVLPKKEHSILNADHSRGSSDAEKISPRKELAFGNSHKKPSPRIRELDKFSPKIEQLTEKEHRKVSKFLPIPSSDDRKSLKLSVKLSPSDKVVLESDNKDAMLKLRTDSRPSLRSPKRLGSSSEDASWKSDASLEDKKPLLPQKRTLESPLASLRITRKARSERRRDDSSKAKNTDAASVSVDGASLDDFSNELEEALLKKQEIEEATVADETELKKSQSSDMNLQVLKMSNHQSPKLDGNKIAEDPSEREEGELAPEEMEVECSVVGEANQRGCSTIQSSTESLKVVDEKKQTGSDTQVSNGSSRDNLDKIESSSMNQASDEILKDGLNSKQAVSSIPASDECMKVGNNNQVPGSTVHVSDETLKLKVGNENQQSGPKENIKVSHADGKEINIGIEPKDDLPCPEQEEVRVVAVSSQEAALHLENRQTVDGALHTKQEKIGRIKSPSDSDDNEGMQSVEGNFSKQGEVTTEKIKPLSEASNPEGRLTSEIKLPKHVEQIEGNVNSFSGSHKPEINQTFRFTQTVFGANDVTDGIQDINTTENIAASDRDKQTYVEVKDVIGEREDYFNFVDKRDRTCNEGLLEPHSSAEIGAEDTLSIHGKLLATYKDTQKNIATSNKEDSGPEELKLSLSLQSGQMELLVSKDDCNLTRSSKSNGNFEAKTGSAIERPVDLAAHKEGGENSVHSHANKKMKVKSLTLSLAPPAIFTSSVGALPQNLQDPVGCQKSAQSSANPWRDTMSFSQFHAESTSGGFTNSLVQSSFEHNLSCSLRQSCDDKGENSCSGGRAFSKSLNSVSERSMHYTSRSDQKHKIVSALHGQHKTNIVSEGMPTYTGDQNKMMGFQPKTQQKFQQQVLQSPSPLDISPINLSVSPSSSKKVSCQRNKDTAGLKSQPTDKIGLLEIASAPIAVMAQKLQELPDSFLEGLKDLVKELLADFTKRDDFLSLQKVIRERTDITEETLMLANPTQLDIFVALRTGMQAFVQKSSKTLTYKALIEIFLQKRCRNVDCQQSLPVYGCECRICSTKPGFCHSCMCMVCAKFDSDTKTCRWVGCDLCDHWCHADCGLRMSHIKPTPVTNCRGGSSQIQYKCLSCGHQMELLGFVKAVFENFGHTLDVEKLTKELDCVRRIFHGSEDLRGKQLCLKAEKMLQKLEGNVDPSYVCRSMLQFFNEADQKVNESYNTSAKDANIMKSGTSSDAVVALSSDFSNVDLRRSVKDDKIPRATVEFPQGVSEKNLAQSTTLQYERSRRKVDIEQLNSTIQVKQAEALMFQARADAARHDVTNLQHILSAKRKQIEEEFVHKYAKLMIEETEERRRKQMEELQLLEKSQNDYQKMKIKIESDMRVLLTMMEASKAQVA